MILDRCHDGDDYDHCEEMVRVPEDAETVLAHNHDGDDDRCAEEVLAHRHGGDDLDDNCVGKEQVRSRDGGDDGCDCGDGNWDASSCAVHTALLTVILSALLLL